MTKANSLEDHEVVAYINGVLDELPTTLRKFINEEATFSLHGRVVFTKMVIRLNDGDDAPPRKHLFEMRTSIADICANKPIGGKSFSVRMEAPQEKNELYTAGAKALGWLQAQNQNGDHH